MKLKNIKIKKPPFSLSSCQKTLRMCMCCVEPLRLFFFEKDATYIKRIRTGHYTFFLQKGPQKIKQLQASPYCWHYCSSSTSHREDAALPLAALHIEAANLYPLSPRSKIGQKIGKLQSISVERTAAVGPPDLVLPTPSHTHPLQSTAATKRRRQASTQTKAKNEDLKPPPPLADGTLLYKPRQDLKHRHRLQI